MRDLTCVIYGGQCCTFVHSGLPSHILQACAASISRRAQPCIGGPPALAHVRHSVCELYSCAGRRAAAGALVKTSRS